MKLSKQLLFVVLFLTGSVTFAGKVEDIQGAVKTQCKKELSSADALKLVKNLFMSCTSGSDVDVDGCKVKCLKANDGAVVGK